MVGGILIPLLLLIGSAPAPAYTCSIRDVRYNIASSLDYPAKRLFEHAQVIFHADSVRFDALLFWRIQLAKNEHVSLDSIMINDVKVESALSGHGISIPDSRSDELNRNRDPDSLVFALPAQGMMRSGINKIEFFYEVVFNGTPCIMDVPIPDSYPYMDCYPRLMHDTDSIHSLNQRFFSLEQISLRIKVPQNVHFMSELEPRRAELAHDTVEYAIDSLNTSQVVWFAFPERYHVQDNYGAVRFDVYRDPGHSFDDDRLREINDAMVFFRSRFGGVPYEKVNVLFAALPGVLGGGAANNFMLLSNRGRSSSLIERVLEGESRSALPHEVAHLWWGSAVNVRDVWLSEALASYWANQYEVEVKGERPFERVDVDLSRLLYRFAMGVTANKRKRSGTPEYYFEGPYVMSMLALQLGGNDFTETCREFYEEYCGRSPGFAEFKDIAQRYASVSLDSFFTCWVDSGYSQNYSIRRVKSQSLGSLYSNSLDLARTGKAKSCVPMEVGYKDGTRETFLLEPDELEHRWTSRSRLASVFIDPNKLILEQKRSDNAWPTPVVFRTVKLSPIENVKLATSVFSDEPGYRLYLLPDIPSHSERFGWDYSAVLVGGGEDWWRDYFLDDTDVLRVGYNSRANGVMYRGYVSAKISNAADWRWTYDLFSERMRGRYESGVGIKCARYWSRLPMGIPIPAMTATVGLTHRQYHRLEGVEAGVWPMRNTTPVKVRVAMPLLPAAIAFERGLRVLSEDRVYYRWDLVIERDKRYFYGRLFIGTSGGDAVQERFDPSEEGGMRGYPPYRSFYDHLWGANVVLRHKLVSSLGGRLFGNHASAMNGDNAISEFGFGLSIEEGTVGVVLDIPAYLSDRNIDSRQWDFSRFRIQVRLLNLKRTPKWDFLVNQ